MNYFITGYSMEETTIFGIVMPKKIYTDLERMKGKKEVTVISEEDLKALRTNETFRALEASRKIRVTAREPLWENSIEAKEEGYKKRIAELEKQLEEEKLKSAATAKKTKAATAKTEATEF